MHWVHFSLITDLSLSESHSPLCVFVLCLSDIAACSCTVWRAEQPLPRLWVWLPRGTTYAKKMKYSTAAWVKIIHQINMSYVIKASLQGQSYDHTEAWRSFEYLWQWFWIKRCSRIFTLLMLRVQRHPQMLWWPLVIARYKKWCFERKYVSNLTCLWWDQ